jgi:type I restriction enzyme S subunit
MQSHSTGIRNLDGDAYKAIKVSFPPLSEQQRIVGILDEAFEGVAAAKASAERNLQSARAIFEGYQEALFTRRGNGWANRPFGELATFRNGINFTKTSRGEVVRIIGVKDFQQHFWAPVNDLDSVTTDGALPEADLIRKNDVLFVRSNGNVQLIGRCVLVGSVAGKTTHSGFTIRARVIEPSINPKYLCHFLKSNYARRKMIESGTGVNIKSLNQETLAALVVPVPSDRDQTKIVDKLENLRRETQHLESTYARKLAALDALKQSLLHEAFSGNL